MGPKNLLAWLIAVLLVSGFLILGAMPGHLRAQAPQDKSKDPSQHAQHPNKPPVDQDLSTQVAELRSKVAKLEALLGPAAAKAGMGSMPGMADGQLKGGMSGMGRMMEMDDRMGGKPGMGGGMSGGGMSMAGGKDDMDMMNMMGMGPGRMGGMNGMGGMKMASALPGFPGASHLYHIGATGFFLDHPEHITLSTEQQTSLNGIKEKALLGQSSSRRRIEAADQELWELTGAAEPDAQKIEAKVREIEKLRGDERLTFIRAVGEAAKVLSDEQRRALLGVAPASPAPAHNR